MIMNRIIVNRYLFELNSLYAFYRYSEHAFSQGHIQQDITDNELLWAKEKVSEVIDKENLDKPEEFLEEFQNELMGQVRENIKKGLPMLRRQILEASYSVLERYLCHVVRIYLHTFPQILKDADKSVHYRTIVDLKKNDAIFEHIIESEVDRFGRLSLEDKKKYLVKRLKMNHQDEVWKYGGEELWKDVDAKRQAIVHKEELPEISHEYLLKATNHFYFIILGIAIFAQTNQGVRFEFKHVSKMFKTKDRPTLR